MKTIENYKVVSNELIAKDVYKIVLSGKGNWVENPGQFINFTVKNGYLKRPISISDYDDNSLTCIYKVVGKGTQYLASLKTDDTVEALVGLGNGFDISKSSDDVLLIGGGVGVPPIYGLAKECLKANKKVTVILGFASQADSFYIDEFKKLGVTVYVSTNDGSIGVKGFVTDVMKKENLTDKFYMACGPIVMLKAIYNTSNANGLLSFESRMGCGFGACMGCSCKTKEGYKRICTEGPVLSSQEVIWED